MTRTDTTPMYADHSVLRGPHHRRPQHDLNLTTDLLDECSSVFSVFSEASHPSHTLLALASQMGSVPIVALFLSRGSQLSLTRASISTPTRDILVISSSSLSTLLPCNSRSVLDLAVINATSEIVEDIIATGARIKNRNAPKVAEYYGCIRMNELLLKHGAEINEIPVTKMSHFECERGLGTALHETAEHSQDSAVQRLSKMGADTALKNSRGKTALDLARQAGCLEVVNILE
ncbi:hypothetical protein E4T56_gene739 [Termitomyces sp. T112]|nr:hypothetical protein E4T56_gene739 [Termitomyces sp. T112]